jgi:hypothetical protein
MYVDGRAAYDGANSFILGMAQSGIFDTINPVLNTTKESYGDLRASEGDANNLLNILDQINNSTDPYVIGLRDKAIHDINRYMHENGGKKFNGDFSYDNLMAMARGAAATSRHQAKYARKHHKPYSDYDKAALASEADQIALGGVDERAQYENARDRWKDIVNDPTTTVAGRIQATEEYGEVLKHLAIKAKSEGNNLDSGKYNTEYMSTKGREPDKASQTMWEASRNAEAVHPANQDTKEEGDDPKGDAYSTSESVRTTMRDYLLLQKTDPATGAPMYAQVYLDGKGQPTSEKTGLMGVALISALPSAALYTHTSDAAGKPVQIVGADISIGPGSVVSALLPEPVIAQNTYTDVTRPLNPSAVGDPTTIGARFVLEDGTPVWSYMDSQGKTKITTENPFNGVPKQGANGWEVTNALPDQRTADRLKNAGTAPKIGDHVTPTFYNADSNSRLANTVFNSVVAAEMAINPPAAYAKYTPEGIRKLALSQAGGDASSQTFGDIYGEIDEMRGAFVKGGGLSFDEQLRISRSNKNGDLPLMSDQIGLRNIGLGGAVGATMPHVDPNSKEAQELDKLLGGAGGDPATILMRNATKAAAGIFGGGLNFSPLEAERTKALAARARSQQSSIMRPPINPVDSRAMANGLVGDIWSSLYAQPGKTDVFGNMASGQLSGEGATDYYQRSTYRPPSAIPKPTPPAATPPDPLHLDPGRNGKGNMPSLRRLNVRPVRRETRDRDGNLISVSEGGKYGKTML